MSKPAGSWADYKKNFKLLCKVCKKPLALHGATTGDCSGGVGKFKPYKDLREFKKQ